MSTLGAPSAVPPPPADPAEAWAFAQARAHMVRGQLVARGIKDSQVLAAMGRVPRQEFLPPALWSRAYEDGPLPIGLGQTISQPYIVAFMTEALALGPQERVLEVGTGSGYQAAVLAGLVAEVYSIELLPDLALRASANLQRLGCGNVRVRCGDGYQGWPEAAPFDAILVTCAPEQIPQALVDQLRVGGRMIIPVGPESGVQDLYLLRKKTEGLDLQAVLPVRFVPMVRTGGKR